MNVYAINWYEMNKVLNVGTFPTLLYDQHAIIDIEREQIRRDGSRSRGKAKKSLQPDDGPNWTGGPR